MTKREAKQVVIHEVENLIYNWFNPVQFLTFIDTPEDSRRIVEAMDEFLRELARRGLQVGTYDTTFVDLIVRDFLAEEVGVA